MINAAIAGLGRWGQAEVQSVNGVSDRLRFVSAVVRDPAKVRDFASRQELQLFTAFQDVLSDPRIQAVVLATPHSLHVPQAIAAARAGKAVLCEKPFALTRADAQRAVDACREAGVVLAVGHDKRFWPSMRELRRVTASGELGDIVHIEGHFSNENARKAAHFGWRESPQEAPAGSLTATGVHVLDAFVNLLGPVRHVQARRVMRQPEPRLLDTLTVTVEFANGATGVLCGVRPTPVFWRIHVFGASASAEAIGETELVIRRSGSALERLHFERVNALRCQLEAFADAIERHAPYPVTIAQALDTTAALEAIVKSTELGAPVPVNGVQGAE